MDWKFIFTSFQGRLNREPYWLGGLAMNVVLVNLGVGLFALVGEGSRVALFGVVCLVILFLWPSLALGVKRLHDRDKSGWWLLLFWLGPAVLSMVGQMVGQSLGKADAVILGLVSFDIFIWGLFELGFLRGTLGANRYGPDPLAAPTARP